MNKQDIVTAVLNLDIFLKIPALQGATARLKPNGQPFMYSGGFNLVFELNHQGKKWAFRVWHVPMGENKARYLKISNYLSSKKLPYFADFIYDEKGLLVNGNFLDTIRMEWFDDYLLRDYLKKYLHDKVSLEKLANNFLKMNQILRKEGISHGDLQHGNILVNNSGEIKLIDYDSICIPEIEGEKELVTGLRGYQHPSRFRGGKASLKADYFSELIIYLSILGLAHNPKLWQKYAIEDTEYLLFTEADFKNFKNSEIYKDLKGTNTRINTLLDILFVYLQERNYLNLEPFVADKYQSKHRPTTRNWGDRCDAGKVRLTVAHAISSIKKKTLTYIDDINQGIKDFFAEIVEETISEIKDSLLNVTTTVKLTHYHRIKIDPP